MAHESQTRLPIVGVMGSGASSDDERCIALGRWLAGERVHLLTGGGGGVMSAVSRAFFETQNRGGLVLGVLPASDAQSVEAPKGYPNPWVEIPIQTHLHLSGSRGTEMASRNHINVLSCDVLIAMAGSWGTHSEVELALRYRRPIVAYLQQRSDIPRLPESIRMVTSLEEVKAFIRGALDRAP